MPDPSLLQRLKERKLVQWAVAYLAGAWVLVEATGHVVDQFHWPQIIGQVVTILAFFGFFVVLVIAWYHGEKGRQWVSGPELLIIALLLLISGGVLSMLGDPSESPEPTDLPASAAVEEDRPSIAVLPFQNRSGVEDDAYFTDGLHDQIITHLTKIGGLSVRGLTSVLVYRDSPKNLKEIGGELNALYIVEGGVQRAGGTVRINVQLIEAATDEHLWANTYDRTMSVENLLAIQTEIVEAVTDSVRAVVTPEELARISSIPTKSLEAYDHYLRGREAVRRRSPGDIQAAFRFFEAALEEDDRFAEAHAGMADAWIVRGWEEADTAYFRRGKEAAERALGLDSLLAEAHTSKAYALVLGEWDWEGPERSFQTAIRLDPNNSEAHHWYGEYLSAIGRFHAGVQETSAALAMDPLAPAVVCDHGSALVMAGRIQEGVSFHERCLELAPTWWAPYANLLLFYPKVGRETDALNVLDQIFRLFGSSEDLASWESLSGMDDFQVVLSRTLEFLETGSGSGSLFLRSSYFLASLHVLAGQPDEAFGYLDSALNERHPSLAKGAMGAITFAPIRDDPRFQTLLQRMGLKE